MVDTSEVIAERLQSSQSGSTENIEGECKANDCSARPEALTIGAIG
jgi:hypothetical protein